MVNLTSEIQDGSKTVILHFKINKNKPKENQKEGNPERDPFLEFCNFFVCTFINKIVTSKQKTSYTYVCLF